MTVVLSIIFCIAVLMLCVAVYDTHRFVLQSYVLPECKVKKDCRIVVIADLHNQSYGKNNELLLSAIDSVSPDLIIIAGDLMVARPGKGFTVPILLLRELCARYPVYYGIGNHEYRLGLYPDTYGNMDLDYRAALHSVPIEMLENQSVILEEFGIRINGLSIEREYYRRRARAKHMPDDYLFSKFGEKRDDLFEIVIAHNPLYFPAYCKWEPNLILAGHVHGGIMKLPIFGGVVSPNLTLFPKYDGGLFSHGNSKMIISRGLGVHTIPIRVFNPGELVVIDLLKEK